MEIVVDMIEFKETIIEDLFQIEPFISNDERGSFCKLFSKSIFDEKGINFEIKEAFFSTSLFGVIRGMHFQVPPNGQDKLVYVSSGEILDVCLDLRTTSGTKGEIFSTTLTSLNGRAIFIPEGVGHGFLVKSDVATVHYLVSSNFINEYDAGIHWNSFGFNWDINKPVISSKDSSLPDYGSYLSPF